MNSMVGQDAVFQGDIKLEEGIIVYGIVYGNIQTQGAVRVSRTGKVHGNIVSSDIHIGGSVEGNVVVEDRVVLGESSVLNGNLTYKSLIIEEGAQFQGQCIILGNETLNDDSQEIEGGGHQHQKIRQNTMNENNDDYLARSFQYLQKIIKDSSPAASASYTLIGGVLIMGFLGYFLDNWLGTKPWLMLIGFLMGLFTGFYELAKTVWRK